MIKVYKQVLNYPAVGLIVGNSPGGRVNNIYSPGSDKLTEVQLYNHVNFVSTRQPGNPALPDVEKPFYVRK